MKALFSGRRLAALVAAALPLSLAFSVVGSAIMATEAAHATVVACISILPSGTYPSNLVDGSPVIAVGSGDCGATTTNTSAAALDVCRSGTETAPPSGKVDGTPVYLDVAGRVVGVYAPPVSVWGDFSTLSGPYGELLVAGTGISSQQTSC